jgi:hypothetical protein
MFNPERLKIKKEIKEKDSVINPDKLIAEIAENPTPENKRKVIDLFYGTPEQKGWLEEKGPEASLALKKILESDRKLFRGELLRGMKEILILKEIELFAGIKEIKSEEDIKKIKEVYPRIDVKKIAENLKININSVYRFINILIRPTDRQKNFLRALYEAKEGEKIHSSILKNLGVMTGSGPTLEVLREIGFINIEKERRIITVDKKNKEQLKLIHPEIEEWSVKPLKKEVIEEGKRAKAGERIAQGIQIIAENIKKKGIKPEEISKEELKKFIKDLSRIDFSIRKINIPPTSVSVFRQRLLKMHEKGKLMPEIIKYIKEGEKISPRVSKL